MAHTFVSRHLVSCTTARRARVCTVKWVTDAGVGAEFIDTTYVATGTRLSARRQRDPRWLLEALEQSIVHTLVIAHCHQRPHAVDPRDLRTLYSPGPWHRSVGDRVLFDDGKIVVTSYFARWEIDS